LIWIELSVKISYTMCLQYTPKQFFDTFLKGNDMTDFVNRYNPYNNLTFIPLTEDDYCEDIYFWYKVRDIGMNDVIERALKRAQTLPFTIEKGCLFIGFTWCGVSYEQAEPFKDFLKEISI